MEVVVLRHYVQEMLQLWRFPGSVVKTDWRQGTASGNEEWNYGNCIVGVWVWVRVTFHTGWCSYQV